MVLEEAATESRPNLFEYYEYLTLEGRFMVPRLLEYLKDLKSNIVTEDSLNQLVKVKTSYPLLPFYGQALGPKDKEGLIQWYLDYFLPAVEGSVQYLYLDSEKGIITTGKGINVENALVTKGVKQKRVAFNPELFAQRTPKALAYRNEIANKVRIFFKSLSLNNKMCLFPHIFWGTITHKGRQNNVEENRAKFLTEEQLNQEILNALDNLVSRKLSHQYGPRYPAKSFLTGDHTIVVDKETTDLVASEKVESAYNRLTRVFPKFLFFPAGAQLALLDMQYNLGEGKFNEYQNLIRIVNGYNFEINNVSESFCRPYHPFYETLRDKEKTNLTQLVNFGGFSTLAKEQSPDWRILAYEMEDPGGGEVLELSEFSHPHCTNFYFWRKRPPLPARNLATFILFILAAEWQNTDFQKINTSEERQKGDYKQFTSQTQKTYPLTISEFTLGLAKGLPVGVYESGKSFFLFLVDFVKHPINMTEQIVNAISTLVNLARNDEWGVVAEALSPEMHQLVTQWDALPSEKRGELAGYTIGKLGGDILVPGALAKVAAKSARSAQELAAICKNLQIAQETVILEATAEVGNSAKVAQLQQTGKLEGAINSSLEKLVSESKSEVLRAAISQNKHIKMVKDYLVKPAKEIQKGISSYEKQITIHKEKITNPTKYYPHWDKLDPRRREALINKIWPKEIKQYEEQRKVLQSILNERISHE